MASHQQGTVYKQIRNLLIVLMLGLSGAAALTLVFLYRYSPPGTYFLKNVMIDPSFMNGSSTVHFNIERLEFTSWNGKKHQMEKGSSSLSTYEAFYRIFGQDQSLSPPPKDLPNQFRSRAISRLTLSIEQKTQNRKEPLKLFQEIQISEDGNFYRIELETQELSDRWVYFYHPEIGKKAQQLFSPQEEK